MATDVLTESIFARQGSNCLLVREPQIALPVPLRARDDRCLGVLARLPKSPVPEPGVATRELSQALPGRFLDDPEGERAQSADRRRL